MSPKHEKEIHDPILKELSETLKKELGQSIKDIILFGSRAREVLSRMDYNLKDDNYIPSPLMGEGRERVIKVEE